MQTNHSDSRPIASILTPTYGRHRFLPILAHMIEHQTYDLSKIEWVVIDDSKRDASTWFRTHVLHTRLQRLTYVHLPYKVSIGCKRNLTKTLARGDYLIHMDDDDYYATNYLSTVMSIFLRKDKPLIIGATTISLIYPNTLYLYNTWPPKQNHTCAGILSYTREYADRHNFPHDAQKAEEPHFLQGNPVTQITHSHNIYMAFVHAYNTVPKKQVQRIPTSLRWTDVVQLPKVALFYLTLHARNVPLNRQLAPKEPEIPKLMFTNTSIDKFRQSHGYQFMAVVVLRALIHIVRKVHCVLSRILYKYTPNANTSFDLSNQLTQKPLHVVVRE
jgi:glycosyltransferase involved in cell wall biosynthesis